MIIIFRIIIEYFGNFFYKARTVVNIYDNQNNFKNDQNHPFEFGFLDEKHPTVKLGSSIEGCLYFIVKYTIFSQNV